jgi:transcriptional antiterminator NusG
MATDEPANPDSPSPAIEPEVQEPVSEPVDSSPEPVPEPADEAKPEPPAAPEVPDNKRWYIVKVQSGREETIKEAIERKVKIEGLEESFGEIYIPTEKVTEMRKGKRYTRQKKTLPGYIMANVEFNDRILYLFRETSGVGDFVGATNNKPPPPMPDGEVKRWKPVAGAKEEEAPAPIKPDFEIGDRVKVKDGMFKEMEGDVKEIVEAKNQVGVELIIFGRPMKVELEYWQVERL